MSKFKVGDNVEFVKRDVSPSWEMTHRKIYEVTGIDRNWVMIICDDGIENGFHHKHFHACAASAPKGYLTASQVRALKAKYCGTGVTLPTNISHDDIVNDSEDDYDIRKANRRVTSAGDFEAGAVVVYKDGTPTLTSLTVKRCTATCVWFEETYSAAFDPNEFTQEY